MGFLLWAGLACSPFFAFVLYIIVNDRRLSTLPARALALSPKRCTPEDVRVTAARLAKSPDISVKDQLPLKTGRRYIVIGGGGFLGGWITTQLIERGEDPTRIRLLDLNPPVNYAVKDALSAGAQFIKVDVTDPASLDAAFAAPWPDVVPPGLPPPELTIFHTASNIRFYERARAFVHRSARVNVAGTQNIVHAARKVGASVLVYTSSGSVGVWSNRFFLWPWEREPKRFVQVVTDEEEILPKVHEDFFSNYAVTKIQAERVVRDADKSPSGVGLLRTGAIRPGNGIFGPRGDMLCGAYLVRQTNPTWIANILQSFVYVENCALTHLLYEARLIDTLKGSKNPDIGGQAFCIADPGPPATYGDVYTTLETLSEGVCHFPRLSPTAMLIVAYLIEIYYTAQHLWPLGKWLPPVGGDLVNLQPPLFNLTQVHLVFDDSRARLSPEKGGLGYKGAWTTVEGLHATWKEHESGVGRSETRSGAAGVSFGFKPKVARAQRAVAQVDEKVVEKIGISPVEVLGMQ